jgi:PIN domain nuclease of toxin-antitoxin system
MTPATPLRLLLDTHTFLWWDSNPSRLSARVLVLCQDPAVVLVLSLVSLWEIQIKSGLGKLPLLFPLMEIVHDQQQKHGLQILPITLDHILVHLQGRIVG